MAKIQVTPVKRSEVSKQEKPELPKATVSTELLEVNGVEGIQVTTFYPLPEDNEVEVTERKGKKTEKVDNSDKIVSILSIIGRAAKVDLFYTAEVPVEGSTTGETTTEEFALTDGAGTQIQFSGKLFSRKKGEGAPTDADDDDDDDDA